MVKFLDFAEKVMDVGAAVVMGTAHVAATTLHHQFPQTFAAPTPLAIPTPPTILHSLPEPEEDAGPIRPVRPYPYPTRDDYDFNKILAQRDQIRSELAHVGVDGKWRRKPEPRPYSEDTIAVILQTEDEAMAVIQQSVEQELRNKDKATTLAKPTTIWGTPIGHGGVQPEVVFYDQWIAAQHAAVVWQEEQQQQQEQQLAYQQAMARQSSLEQLDGLGPYVDEAFAELESTYKGGSGDPEELNYVARQVVTEVLTPAYKLLSELSPPLQDSEVCLLNWPLSPLETLLGQLSTFTEEELGEDMVELAQGVEACLNFFIEAVGGTPQQASPQHIPPQDIPASCPSPLPGQPRVQSSVEEPLQDEAPGSPKKKGVSEYFNLEYFEAAMAGAKAKDKPLDTPEPARKKSVFKPFDFAAATAMAKAGQQQPGDPQDLIAQAAAIPLPDAKQDHPDAEALATVLWSLSDKFRHSAEEVTKAFLKNKKPSAALMDDMKEMLQQVLRAKGKSWRLNVNEIGSFKTFLPQLHYVKVPRKFQNDEGVKEMMALVRRSVRTLGLDRR